MHEVSRLRHHHRIAGRATLGLLLTVLASVSLPRQAFSQDVALPPGCGSDHVGIFVKRTILKDRNPQNGMPDRWFVEGDFDIAQAIDPVANQPTLTFNWDSTSRDFPPHADFAVGTNGQKWRYIFQPSPPNPTPGFYRGFLRQLRADRSTPTGSKVHFIFFGKGVDIADPSSAALPSNNVLRQSIKIGQFCASSILCCKRTGSTQQPKLRCTGPTNGACPQ